MSGHSERHDMLNLRSIDSKTKRNNYTQMLGKRRKFVKSLLNLEAMQNAIEELMPGADGNMHYSSEYNDKFCVSTISHSADNDGIPMKYPLYSGCIQTVYSQLIMESALKDRNTIADITTPFRRNSVISLSPGNDFN